MSTVHIVDDIKRRRKVKIYFNKQGRKYILINGMKKFLGPGNIIKQIKELLRTKRRKGVKRANTKNVKAKNHLNETAPLILKNAQLQANLQHKLNELTAKEKKEVKEVVKEVKQIAHVDDRIAVINQAAQSENLTPEQTQLLYAYAHNIKQQAVAYVKEKEDKAKQQVVKEKQVASKLKQVYKQSEKANNLRSELNDIEKRINDNKNKKKAEIEQINDSPYPNFAELKKLAIANEIKITYGNKGVKSEKTIRSELIRDGIIEPKTERKQKVEKLYHDKIASDEDQLARLKTNSEKFRMTSKNLKMPTILL